MDLQNESSLKSKALLTRHDALVPLPEVRVIAFTGYRHSGKTTACHTILEKKNKQYKTEWKEINFADSLKATCRALFGFTTIQTDFDKETVDSFWGITPRVALQKFGTEVVRNTLGKQIGYAEDSHHHWHAMFYRTVLNAVIYGVHSKTDPLYILVGDLRFPDEAAFLMKNFNTRIFYILNPRTEPEDKLHLHESEIHIGTFPVHKIIENRLDIQTFKENIKKTINSIDFSVNEEMFIPHDNLLINFKN